ncbi:MAG: hypothetical protein M1814_002717 [Vezdaea aestivalis]|nr:MAG: hypothetical protein M1814_002717 [Vezdaea aestivalis]
MSNPPKYLLVSLPTSIVKSKHEDEALESLSATVTSDLGTTVRFKVPDFKIGSLDALVRQADELAKLGSGCEAVVGKVTECLRNILEGDEAKVAEQKTVNDKPVDQYLRTFSWNKIKYRADRPIGELIDSLQKEVTSIDNDMKSKYNQYNQVKTTLRALQRKQTGNLSTKSLAQIVDPKLLIKDSEYLETHLIAVPAQLAKYFFKTYESVAPMVVPRSGVKIASDDEFTLFAVTGFKKYSTDFRHKCRENKWIPRDFKYVEGGKEDELKEVERVSKDEEKLWREARRLGSTSWGESVMIWVHVLTLKVFVETVLRYGLPLDFVCGMIKTSAKASKKIKTSLDQTYSYLGGNAFGRDKKGRITKDDASVTDLAAAGHSGEYSAYVYYELDPN